MSNPDTMYKQAVELVREAHTKYGIWEAHKKARDYERNIGVSQRHLLIDAGVIRK